MKQGQNFNHPEKGSSIKVDPIKELKDIRSIKKLLHDKPRDLCLFILGINTNLRASDLLKIKVNQVSHLKPEDELTLNETKTGKPRRITLNKAVIGSIQALLSSKDYNDQDYLFTGQRGCGRWGSQAWIDFEMTGRNFLITPDLSSHKE